MQKLRYRGLNPFRWSEYSLIDEGVMFREKDFSGLREGVIEYDRIGREATYFSHQSVPALVGTLLVTAIALLVGVVAWTGGDAEKSAWIFWLIVALPFFAYYLSTRQTGFFLSSGFGSLVLRGKKDEVATFISEIEHRKPAYIEGVARRRLIVLEPIEVERLLLALYEGKVLAESDYWAIRSNLGLEVATGPRIGFSHE